MQRMSLTQIRSVAIAAARSKGHSLRWRSSRPWRYTARCTKCGADLTAYSEAQNSPLRADYDIRPNFVALDVGPGATDLDYNWVMGSALATLCRA